MNYSQWKAAPLHHTHMHRHPKHAAVRTREVRLTNGMLVRLPLQYKSC